MTTIGQHQPEDLDLEGMSARDVIGLGHVVTQDQEGVVGMIHSLKRKGDLGQKRERMNIDHPKKGGGEMTLLHQHSTTEDKSKDRSSQQSQSQAGHDQQRALPPLPPPATAPPISSQPQVSVAQAAPAQPAQTAPAQVAQAAPAQAAQTAPAQVAKAAPAPAAQTAPAQVLATHAIGATAAQLPIAKAMPIQQQPQGQALAQPLPQPLYPPHSAMIQVPARPQAQQLAAPPGLGTNLERTQYGATARTITCNASTSTSETILPITIWSPGMG